MSKPYRERAELFAQNPQGRIYGGFYPGQGFGTFGGGIDPGEDPQEAAAREFQEESGYPVSNVRPAPVDPYVEDWKPLSKKPEYANDPKFQERFKKFKGSRTHYFLGDIAGKRESKGSNDSAYPFESVRFRAAPTVISKHEKDLQSVTDPIDIARLQQRLAVLRNLQGTNKEAEFFIEGRNQALRDLGYSQADCFLNKTAVSRWREAIYSGELPQDQREALKEYMGATPERHMEGVRKGSIAQAERLGVKIKENFRGTGGKYYPHIKTIGIPSEKAAIKHINAWMSSFPTVNKWFKERGADNLGKETVSRVLRHEIGEAQAGARRLRTGRSESIITGKNQKAPRLGKAMETGGAKVFGLLRGITGNKRLFSDALEHSGGIIHGHNANHYSPRIIFDDMRNSRMLSPQSQSMDFGGHAQSGALDMFKTTPDFLKHDGLFVRKRDIPALSAMVLDYNRTKTPWGATQEGVEQAARRAEQVGSSIRKFFTRVR